MTTLTPGKQSGKYSLHYDTVVSKGRPSDRNWYRVGAPIFRKCIGERCVSDIAVSKCIAKHGATIIPKFQQARDNLRLPQCYYTHPVVLRNSGGLVFAFGVYIDAVDFTRQDSEVGIWLIDIYSGQRWCVVVLKVSELCKCGCSSNCTFHPFWVMLRWSFLHLARGSFPESKHDGGQFDDDGRKLLAGTSLGIKGCCNICKSDWSEWTKLGFRSWKHGMHPCPLCDCESGNMRACDNVSRYAFPFTLKV